MESDLGLNPSAATICVITGKLLSLTFLIREIGIIIGLVGINSLLQEAVGDP